MPEITTEGLERIVQGMTIKLPSVLRRMAFNIDANVASEGRLQEETIANRLRMGNPQKKGFGPARVRSKWDPNVGWVSTSRSAGKGGTGFRMASFGWERVKKASVTAPYSNQLANLWHRPTKPYRETSPRVGSPGHYMRWMKGARRPVRYSWATTYRILANMAPQAVARTEKQFKKEIEEL